MPSSQQIRQWNAVSGPTDYVFSDGDTDVLIMELHDGTLRVATQSHAALYPRWSVPWTKRGAVWKPNHDTAIRTIRIHPHLENGYEVGLRYGRGPWTECQAVWF